MTTARYKASSYRRGGKQREERADRGREKMVPVGAATMSDEEFWRGHVDATARLMDESRTSKNLDGSSARFRKDYSSRRMAEY